MERTYSFGNDTAARHLWVLSKASVVIIQRQCWHLVNNFAKTTSGTPGVDESSSCIKSPNIVGFPFLGVRNGIASSSVLRLVHCRVDLIIRLTIVNANVLIAFFAFVITAFVGIGTFRWFFFVSNTLLRISG